MAKYGGYSSGVSERILTIPEFTGIDQSRGAHSPDVGSSPAAKNFISRQGRLYTAPGVSQYGSSLPDSNHDPENGRLFQVFIRDEDGEDTSKLLVAQHGRFYVSDLEAETWTPIAAGFQSNDWDAINYRDLTNEWIILTNGTDDPQYWDGTSSASFPLTAKQGEDDLTFSKITLLYERLWGAVAKEYPDRVYWSNSFNAQDWELDYENADNGGGMVDVATFDGTRIRAIVAAFDDVLIFKDKSMHRLNGTYPGEFSLSQVYGSEGTLAPRTIVYNGDMLFFLSIDGLCAYNGMVVTTLAASGDRKLKDIWSRINGTTIQTACAVLKDGIIYLAVPLDGSAINTHVIEYDIKHGVYSLVSLAGVDDWLIMREGQKETLLFLNGETIYQYGAGNTFYGEDIDACWLSPEITCGTLSSRKQTGRIYMLVNATSIDVDAEPSMKLTLYSGDKQREKVIPLKSGRNEIRKRVKIRGRTFRFKIENVDGNPLTIHRGIEIHVEEDFD
jgi:hypothetical protein